MFYIFYSKTHESIKFSMTSNYLKVKQGHFILKLNYPNNYYYYLLSIPFSEGH